MNLPPLKVAFFWHMHQPSYKDPRTGVYRLPWVRLHAVKDYYDMAARLDGFPRLKANFNLVPILVEQLQDYASGQVNEVQFQLAAKDPDDLTNQEKLALIKDSFLGYREKMIEPYPRYRSLLDKCPNLDFEYKAQAAIRKCGRQDFMDVQVWSNLAWIDPILRHDPLISGLLHRGRQFTSEMKAGLLGKQMEVIRSILPKYKELADAGRIELTTSPYYHPILPLVCDSEVARAAMPGVSLPKHRVRQADDARMQLALAQDLHKAVFGKAAIGMWSPECSVSDEALATAAGLGFRWTAADEGVLEASCGTSVRDRASLRVTRPDLLYRPHRIALGGGEVTVFFRDKILSDLVSFEYMKLPAAEAVADFIGRLESIRRDLGAEAATSVVLVALDGENCWEFYDDDGDAFLNLLYRELSARDGIETVLLSDVLESVKTEEMRSIFPGSWIGSNFAIWIGSSEDNAAWDMISEARTELVAREGGLGENSRRLAWRSVYAAEGSDWFWWYGGEHVSRHNPEYDALFRSHIRHIYEIAGAKTPNAVLRPILMRHKGPAFTFEPVAVIRPVLDGRVTTFYEWRLAGLYESYKDVSRHTPVAPVISAIHFGFDHDNLYVRLDTGMSPQGHEFAGLCIRVEFDTPRERTVTFLAPGACSPGRVDLDVGQEDVASGARAVALEIIEIAVPFKAIGVEPGGNLAFRVALARGDQILERRPFHEVITLTAPTPDFDAEMWSTL